VKHEKKRKDRYSDQHAEIKLMAGESELRDLVDKVDKAVYILRNYSGEVKLTVRGVCDYFKITRDRCRNRMWSILLGYTEHTVDKPRYLAPVHESRLANILDLNNRKNNSSIKDELLLMVM
jgi:hypothetical protein